MFAMYMWCVLLATVLRMCAADANVGSVLFTHADTLRGCWSMESVALLQSRMIMEDLLPSEETIRTSSCHYVDDLLEYFHLVLDTTRKTTYGRIKYLMLLGASDAIGGYLHHMVIPHAKAAYYAGQIDYECVHTLMTFHKQLMGFLGTDGRGWRAPIVPTDKMLKATPLVMKPPNPVSNPCKGLVFYETASENRAANDSEKTKIIIPMPFFDANDEPHSIAVPFKLYPLRNLETKASAYVIVKYYIASVKCLEKHQASVVSRSTYDNNVMAFIKNKVKPHLNDARLYAAFGGVLRIYETLQNRGAIPKESEDARAMSEERDNAIAMPGSEEKAGKRLRFILIALLVTVFIWFILGTAFICNRIRKQRSHKSSKMQLSSKSRVASTNTRDVMFGSKSADLSSVATNSMTTTASSASELGVSSSRRNVVAGHVRPVLNDITPLLSETGMVEVPSRSQHVNDLSQKISDAQRAWPKSQTVLYTEVPQLSLVDMLSDDTTGQTSYIYGYERESTARSTSDYSTD